MATYEYDDYGALREINDSVDYLNTVKRSEFYNRVADGRLPPLVKVGDRSRCINGELREIRNAYARGATDDEVRELVRQLVAIRPLLQGRSDDEIRELIRKFVTVRYQPQDTAPATPTPTAVREGSAKRTRRKLFQPRASVT
ncbi:MAG TPA: hypothetical protein VKB53_12115 [Gammaproteobacteria bacterium]|nr:hypothetical protein [Gammaproteobacteria bacterium]